MAMNNKNDNRSKKIVFCSSCLLNTNNKVLPLARYGGFSKEFIDILAKYDLGVQQMDCPETLYLASSAGSTPRIFMTMLVSAVTAVSWRKRK